MSKNFKKSLFILLSSLVLIAGSYALANVNSSTTLRRANLDEEIQLLGNQQVDLSDSITILNNDEHDFDDDYENEDNIIKEIYEYNSQTDEGNDEIDYENKIEVESKPERIAFLTFDDGPTWNTDRILDILQEENVPATFFVIGDELLNFSDPQRILERILADGHYLGLHSMTHSYQTLYRGYGAAQRFVDEMLQLQGIIYDKVGHHTNLCRAPFGMMTGFRPGSGHREAVDEANLKCIDWNIDPQDWRNNSTMILEYLTNQINHTNIPPEIVIVLHEENSTVEALPAIIEFLRSLGYEFRAYEPGHEFIYQQHRF